MNSIRIPEQSNNVKWHHDIVADVLYISVGEPVRAVGVDVGKGLVLRVDEAKNEVVGLTIIGLRQRLIRYYAE